jgi:DNA-binding response OmpR family regulator
MEKDYTIFLVDDDKTIRFLLQSILAGKYTVESFDCAESCLIRLAEKQPNLFVLDVGLPGISGYDLCRAIKAAPASAHIPVMFLSARDEPQEVMAGYDAGGQDYITKPFDVIEFYRKIENVQRIEYENQSLSVQVQASDELTTLVLANLDEYAVLIKFLRRLNECNNVNEIVEATLSMIQAFRLEGSVQIRMRHFERTFSAAGENWPLEIAVINHVRTLDRIFQFQKRAAFNFEHITLLISNMPVDNPDLNSRVRDNLAMAIESVDAKLIALQSLADNATMRSEIHHVLTEMDATVASYSQAYNQARYQGTLYTTQFLDNLLATFAHLALSDQQEQQTMTLFKGYADQLSHVYDIAGNTKSSLSLLGNKLEAILAVSEDTLS